MSNRKFLGAAMVIAALVSMPQASQAHCLSYKKMGSEVSAAVDGSATFVKRVAYRTEKFGHRLFGWLNCKNV